jgi:protoporphyrinogen oxidase
MFLLNHTEKLWGLPAEVLSPVIAGQRLKGLSVRTVLSEALSRTPKGGSHMEGNFYYPAKGFGSLPEKLGELCGAENIRRNAKITSVRHDGQAVTQLLVNGDEACRSDVVVSTLPVHLLLRMLDPLPPRSVMERAGRIHFRNLVLAAFFVDKENLTDAASVYFPQKEIPFTRIYEPKHRSRAMSPPGKTSLMVELPCGESDAVWNQDDRGITELVFRHLNHLGWIDKKDVIATAVKRIRYAYPVFDREYQENIEPALRFLDSLKNLRVIGRNGRFVYTWFHNAMRFGKDTIDELCLPP